MEFIGKNKVWIIAALGLFLVACGYRFSGSGDFPAGISTLRVEVFENRTAETGVENIITNDLIYEITRDQKVVLTTTGPADAVLSGAVVALQAGTVAHKGVHTASERRVVLAVDVKLTGRDGQVIREVQGISDNETFVVAAAKQGTLQNQRAALAVLSKRLAQKIYYRLTDNF